jgi:isoquinoline 1-oxidoreductase alpha subunit
MREEDIKHGRCLAQGGTLHPVQQAWVDNDVAQCGYCPTDDDIDEAMGGNLCRCGTYFRIRSAIKQVAAGK